MNKNVSIIVILSILLFGACGNDSHNVQTEQAEDSVGVDHTAPKGNNEDTLAGEMQNTEELAVENSVKKGFEQAAKSFMESYRDERFIEFVQFMHPAVVKVYGGKEAFISQLKDSKKQDNQRYRKWEAGTLEAFTAAKDDRGRITGWYAVVPIKRWLEGSKENEYQLQWLGGQSLDGKRFHFIDITDGDKGMIYRIMPDMRFLLENLDETQVPQS